VSDIMRRVIETEAESHNAYRIWKLERAGYDSMRDHAYDMVHSGGWSYATVCKAIDELERKQVILRKCSTDCDISSLESLRAHAAAANELGRYSKEENE